MHILFCATCAKKNNLYIDEELVKSQIASIKENEKTYHNIQIQQFYIMGVKDR